MPLLGDPEHREMVVALQQLAARLPRPAAIVVISAHWEAAVPTVTAAANPSLIYDYYGFPPESYQIQYPCPGQPSLARQIHQALDNAGIKASMDATRGYDHGVFVPLKIMYPRADIPCVQLSLVKGLDAGTHIALGQALRTLDQERLLVIGSGFSFHNLPAFFAPVTRQITEQNQAFQNWLMETFSSRQIDEAQRRQRLLAWADAPHARFCHPREEHLLPLHVCYGMAGRACDEAMTVTILGKESGMFYWQGA